MTEATVPTEVLTNWKTEHREGTTGRLISMDFKLDIDGLSKTHAGLLRLYHKRRIEYAEKYRDKDIPMHLRTGEDTPGTSWGLIKAILKIGG